MKDKIGNTRTHIEKVLAGESTTPHRKSFQAYDKELTIEALDNMVMYFKWKYDANLGIKWHIEYDSLVRDASNQTGYNAKAAEATAWTGQFVNSCRGALIYLDYHHQKNGLDTKQINKKIGDLLRRAGESNLKSKGDLSLYNIALINDIVNTIGITSAEDKKQLQVDLEKALCCAGFRDPHYNISTITSLGDGNFSIESDIKLSGLTEEMKGEVAAVAAKDLHNTRGPKWYEKLADFDQFLSKEACRQFANANYPKVIPTQFLPFKLMPGLRNAYVEVTYGKKAGGEVTELLQVYRSSNPIANYKKDDEFNLEATKASIAAFTENIDGGKVCLNPLTNACIEEKKFHTLINKAVAADHNNLSKGETPVNVKRIFHIKRDFSGFEKILDFADNILKDKEIEQADKAALENLKECRSRLGNSFLNGRAPDSMGDNNYQLSLKMAQAVHDLKRGPLQKYMQDQEAEIPEIMTFCKSGKDRTGIRMRMGSDAALSNYFGYDAHARVEMRSNTIKAGHQQHLCGAGGGVPLCYGIKAFGTSGEFGSSMPLAYRKQGLGLKTADGNRFPCDKEFEKDIYANEAKQKAESSTSNQVAPYRADNYSQPPTTSHSRGNHSKSDDNIFMFSSLFLWLFFGGGFGLLLVAIMLAMTMEENKITQKSNNQSGNSYTEQLNRQRNKKNNATDKYLNSL